MPCQNDNNLSHDCISRHEALDHVKEQVSQIFEVICGGMEPEKSMKTKVDVLFSERHERRSFNQKLILAFTVTLFTIIFWCGWQAGQIDSHSKRLDKIDEKLDAIVKIENQGD